MCSWREKREVALIGLKPRGFDRVETKVVQVPGYFCNWPVKERNNGVFQKCGRQNKIDDNLLDATEKIKSGKMRRVMMF